MDGLTFSGNWILWKTGTNYQGTTALFNLQTATTEVFPDWGISPLLVTSLPLIFSRSSTFLPSEGDILTLLKGDSTTLP